MPNTSSSTVLTWLEAENMAVVIKISLNGWVNKYLRLLTKFEGRTVSYGLSFKCVWTFSTSIDVQGPWIKMEKKGAIAYNMDKKKKQVSKMFIITRGNLTELQTTPLSQAITVHVVPKLLLLLQLTLVTLKIKGT